MSSADDVIEIPIEIRRKDIKDLDETEKKIDNIEKKTKKIKDTTSNQAVPTLDIEDERGGIFGGARDVKQKPFKDKTSSAPFQRQNEFKKLRDELKNVKESQARSLSALDTLMGGNLATGNLGLAGGVIGGNVAGMLKGVTTTLVPFIAPALLAFGFADTILDMLLAPGGPFDRRWKREIKKEIAAATEREEKALIRQGIKNPRVTAYPGFRGPGVSVNIQRFNLQDPIYEKEFEFIGKNVI